jgi:signal peptidase I
MTDSTGDDGKRSRRLLRRILLATLPLFAIVWVLLPNVGPVFRPFHTVSTSMSPALHLGSMFLVSRASYGYSRHSFDWFALPIVGRWPSLSPARGDIIVFRRPGDTGTFFVSRAIGLPGDRVQLKGGRLLLNGTMVAREGMTEVPDPLAPGRSVPSYAEHLSEGISHRILEALGDTGPYDTTAEVEVPAGHIFVMGDNRDNSVDSRIGADRNGVGLVPIENIVGRVIYIL